MASNINAKCESIWTTLELVDKAKGLQIACGHPDGWVPESVPDFELDEYRHQIEHSFDIGNIQYVSHGSFGFVYKGVQPSSGIKYSIKVQSTMTTEPWSFLSFCKDAKNELHILQKLRHDNIVKYFDCLKIIGKTNGNVPIRFIIKMEYLELTLEQAISVRTFNDAQCLRLANQIGLALAYIHHNSIAHNDLKPNNIMIESRSVNANQYTFKLIDFGLAKIYPQTMNNARDSFFMGPELFMAPEKSRHEEYNPFLTDSYSFGISLLISIVGLVPYQQMWLRYYKKEFPRSVFKMHTSSQPLINMLARLMHAVPEKRSFIYQVLQSDTTDKENCTIS